MWRALFCGLLAVSLAGCGESKGESAPDASAGADSGVDAGGGGPDSGNPTPDGGTDGGQRPDAGTADAGTPDGGSSDAGGVVACPGPFIVCEDFEHGIDAGTWTEQGTGLALDSSRAHRGAYSIHFSANNSLLKTTQPFPRLAHDLWARVFVYMDQLPPGSTASPLGPNASFAWAAGNGGDTRVGFRHTRYSGGYNYPGYDFTNTDSQTWPLDNWVCVEWHYQSDPDGGQGTQDYWMNGVELTDMHFAPHPMPAFTYFWIGMYLFGSADGGSNFDLWMDDLVVDAQQVGCVQ